MEILHKAKRLNTGKWVEGYYQKRHDIDGSFQHFIFWSKSHTVWEYAEVDPETVCVYIGKKDISGKKIFNNDRIQFDDMGEEGFEYREGYDFKNEATVVWNNGRFELKDFADTNSGVLDEMSECHEDFMYVFENCRVVGNVFDNPEMVKVE